MDKYTVKARLRLFRSEEPSYGPGVARLMELVMENGSMAEACRIMNMSYSKGWRIVRRAENDLGIKLLVGAKGGRNGGSMTVTEEGEDLLRKYRMLEAELNEELGRLYIKYFEQ